MEEIEKKSEEKATNDKNYEIKSGKFYPYNVLVSIFAFYFLGAILLAMIQTFLPEKLPFNYDLYSQGISQLLFLLIPTLLFSQVSVFPIKEILRINKNFNPYILLLSILGILSLQLLASGLTIVQENLIPPWLEPAYREYEVSLRKIYGILFRGTGTFDYLMAILIASLIPAFTEEFLFRGFIQKNLEQKMLPMRAILITSIIFSMLHFNPINFLPLILIGLYLGFIAFITNNIYIPIIIHFINNFIAVSFMYYPQLSKMEEDITNIPVREGILLLISGLFLTITVCFWIIRVKKMESETTAKL